MEDLKEKIARLESEIEQLPVGYISRKTINGTVRQYHQWTENGKKKSKYLDDETAAFMAERIAARRGLQQELRTAKALLPKASKNKPVSSAAYNINMLTGEVLRQFTSRSANLKSRPCLQAIQTFLNSDAGCKVLILYGLR